MVADELVIRTIIVVLAVVVGLSTQLFPLDKNGRGTRNGRLALRYGLKVGGRGSLADLEQARDRLGL